MKKDTERLTAVRLLFNVFCKNAAWSRKHSSVTAALCWQAISHIDNAASHVEWKIGEVKS